jgi:hypothetical protein
MKSTNFKPFFIITLLIFASFTSAQSGAIYYLSFDVDPVLIDYKTIEFKGIASSKRDEMPEQLIDSIKIKTEIAFSNKFQMPVKMCIHKFKSETLNSLHPGYIGGLPFNTLNRAKDQFPNNSRYINLNVDIRLGSGSGSESPLHATTKSKSVLTIYIKVYDENKNEVWKKNIRIKSFEKLRSTTIHYGIVDVTKSAVLSPIDIYEMYLKGLDLLMKE